MKTGLIEMPNSNILSRASIDGAVRDSNHKEVPIRVMGPEAIRRQVALMGADRGGSISTVVLRGFRMVGIDVPDSEFGSRCCNGGGGGNGAQ